MQQISDKRRRKHIESDVLSWFCFKPYLKPKLLICPLSNLGVVSLSQVAEGGLAEGRLLARAQPLELLLQLVPGVDIGVGGWLVGELHLSLRLFLPLVFTTFFRWFGGWKNLQSFLLHVKSSEKIVKQTSNSFYLQAPFLTSS